MLLIILDLISKAGVFITLFGILFLIASSICDRLIKSTKEWTFTTGDIVAAAISLALILNLFTIASPYR